MSDQTREHTGRAEALRLRAHNYATGSENFIHADAGGGRYGFRGGLVPGIAVYAYMIRPALKRWGAEWLASGAAAIKVIRPVYDGEEIVVEVGAAPDGPSMDGPAPGRMELFVVDAAGETRAAGWASLGPAGLDPAPGAEGPPRLEDYPAPAPPVPGARLEASLRVLRPGTPLGRRDLTLDLALAARTFVPDVLDDSSRFARAPFAAHPALLLAQANTILRDNIALGAWVHTASELRNHAAPEDGETISLRGRIAETRVRRGHEIVAADLAMFGRGGRPLMRIMHEAIIRLAEPDPAEEPRA